MAKAEAAEQKAETADDPESTAQAWRDAARQWERAADRETNARLRAEYTANAERARAAADAPPVPESLDDLPN